MYNDIEKEVFNLIKHNFTEPSNINFSKLEERIMAVNHPDFTKVEQMREMLYRLVVDGRPTLIMATGGSKVVAYYLQLILERIRFSGIIAEVIEPRDYFYKANLEMYSNLIVISASGRTNGVREALSDFKGNKYLICEEGNSMDNSVISWKNELYEKEKSFISLASSLAPITLLLDVTTSISLELSPKELQNINEKIHDLLLRSEEKVEYVNTDFKDINLVQIMSGYETKTSSSALESNLTESGSCIPVIHDKGSFCHGRSNLLFQNPESRMIYLTHEKKELDRVLLDLMKEEYSDPLIFNTEDLNDDIFWKEYYLLLQMYFLSRKISEDKEIDLTQPEYNPNIVQKIYKFKGEM